MTDKEHPVSELIRELRKDKARLEFLIENECWAADIGGTGGSTDFTDAVCSRLA